MNSDLIHLGQNIYVWWGQKNTRQIFVEWMKEEVPIWFPQAHASRKHTYDVNHLPKMVYSDE